MLFSVPYYIEAFQKMKRAVVRGYVAPHKPLLLIAVCDLIADGIITCPRIELNDVLVSKFKELWILLVDNGNSPEPIIVAEGLLLEVSDKYPFKCNFANPFYYLQFDKFWHLHKSDNYAKKSTYSLQQLKKCFDYAEIDTELFELMREKTSRVQLRNGLLDLL